MTPDTRRRLLLATHNAALVLADLTAALLEAEAENDAAPANAPATDGLEALEDPAEIEAPEGGVAARRRFMDRVRSHADEPSAPHDEATT